MIQAILRRCKKCGRYTLNKERCPYCGGEVENPHPPKYSPDDRYFMYRLFMKIMSGKLQLPEDVKNRLIEKAFKSREAEVETSQSQSS